MSPHTPPPHFRVCLCGRQPDLSWCGYLHDPAEESGYEVATRFAHISAWLVRVRAIPGWASPYDILPGERLAPKW